IAEAARLEPGSVDIRRDGAKIAAFAAKCDPIWIDPMFAYLQQAIKLGLDPAEVRDDSRFSSFHDDSRWQRLMSLPRPTDRTTPTPRLLDPLD
ncbi:MAG: hypothetical protein AB7K24_29830, partial [Gemmataceae bacterium]